ncbi:hypothetical protein [Arthrobacter sp. ok362]|uniref:hypothetical protein n=1 Tax=Arthrobacter sp. ok362 TaxID=1761745 RepID=UPI00089268B6|nr:hypothetical protein [Arthrobacter sp. ok362]SDL97746.1 hypothetical protein SAMN04487913_11946 [Arthrobacter sp. ok362]
MASPQRERIPLPLPVLAAVGVAAAVSLTRALVPALRTEQWDWIHLAFHAIVLVVAVTYFVKFVRKQRDDYRLQLPVGGACEAQ